MIRQIDPLDGTRIVRALHSMLAEHVRMVLPGANDSEYSLGMLMMTRELANLCVAEAVIVPEDAE